MRFTAKVFFFLFDVPNVCFCSSTVIERNRTGLEEGAKGILFVSRGWGPQEVGGVIVRRDPVSRF